ncbi:tRNA (adenosine(37)-N6)-threonylcarbamoyltransferase complex ATPase subunit type 1 TsaE [Candidatus Azambacteria bacterium]|nr:tRNA (adenosine(37)-N6)-threonylcarbamoyltransferase complex ATPase subunit type 1 TsaE [Candidatus Azambacteria bacterium]
MRKTFITRNAKETQALAVMLAKELRGGEVIALEGELGAGKTTLVQGLAKGLGIKEKVLSPTFVIMKFFDVPAPRQARGVTRVRTLVHVDCYRIKSPKELLALGWRELLKEKSNTIVIEWADRVRLILPRHYLSLRFRFANHDQREILFKNF